MTLISINFRYQLIKISRLQLCRLISNINFYQLTMPGSIQTSAKFCVLEVCC